MQSKTRRLAVPHAQRNVSARAFALASIFLTSVAAPRSLPPVSVFSRSPSRRSLSRIVFFCGHHRVSYSVHAGRFSEKYAAGLFAQRPLDLRRKPVVVLGQQGNLLTNAQVLGNLEAEPTPRDIENDDVDFNAVGIYQYRRTTDINSAMADQLGLDVAWNRPFLAPY